MLKTISNYLIQNWKEYLYLLSLATFLVALTTSVAFITGTTIALFVVWILTGNYKDKWNRLIHNRSALLLMCIPLLYLVGLAFTQNLSLGLREINKSLHWLTFAFILGSSPPISKKATYGLLGIYILAVIIASTATFFTIILSESQTLDFRSVTWIDHIPFSYQIAFAIWLLFYFSLNTNFSKTGKLLLIIPASFLLITLLLLKSLNGFIYFGTMSVTAFIMLVIYTKNKVRKIIFSVCLFLIVASPVCYIIHCINKFYDINEFEEQNIEKFTTSGNVYLHDFEDKTKENGNYVALFICDEELMPLWNAHSKKQYSDLTVDGFPLYSVMHRYMTSKGLTKDAEGFARLSQNDIDNIENGITNYIYAGSEFSIYTRIYETIWEIDIYRISKNPNGKSSAQRIEQARLAVKIINKHPWIGIGLGNNAIAYDKIIEESGSKLAQQQTGTTHNQYLNYLMRFGVLGTLFIISVLFWVFLNGRKNNPFLITIFFVSMLVANLGEANWETYIGLIYFNFFLGFLMWIAPKSQDV